MSAAAPLLVLALALAGCAAPGRSTGGGGSQDRSAPAIGTQDQVFTRPKVSDLGEVSYGMQNPAQAYNNNVSATRTAFNTEVLSQVQPGAFFIDLVGGKQVIKIDGDLLSSFTVKSVNPEVLEYKIRTEAVWSDGAPVDCSDFYLQWLAGHSKVTVKGSDGKESSIFDTAPTGYENIDKLTCADNGKTVTATFGTPFADYRSLFNPLLPAHVVAQAAGVADLTTVTDADPATVTKVATVYTTRWSDLSKDQGLSAGPYRIASSDARDLTVLVRNDKWWGNPGGPSKIDIRTNNDAESLAQQLLNKEITVAEPDADGAVANSLRGRPDVQLYAAGGQTYEHIDLNFANPLFQDIAVRRAFAACVPRRELVDKLIKDVQPDAVPLGNVMFMPNERGYQDDYPDTGNGDATAAATLLSDAGYTRGPDGIFAKDGRRVSFKLGHRITQRREDTVRIVAAACRQAGIDVIDDESQDFNDSRLPAGEFDAALFAWVGSPFKSGPYGNYASKAAGGTSNYQNSSDPQVDQVFKQATTELDLATQTQQLQQVDRLIKADASTIPLFQVPDFLAGDATVGPLSVVGAGGGGLWNAFAWQRK